MSGFSEKYLDHFTNPRGVGEVANPTYTSDVAHEGGGCFDKIHLTVKTSDALISEAKFRARACSGTIAACSGMIEMVNGKSIVEAIALTVEDLKEYLGGVPERKQHSVELAVNSLRTALGSPLSSN